MEDYWEPLSFLPSFSFFKKKRIMKLLPHLSIFWSFHWSHVSVFHTRYYLSDQFIYSPFNLPYATHSSFFSPNSFPVILERLVSLSLFHLWEKKGLIQTFQYKSIAGNISIVKGMKARNFDVELGRIKNQCLELWNPLKMHSVPLRVNIFFLIFL